MVARTPTQVLDALRVLTTTGTPPSAGPPGRLVSPLLGLLQALGVGKSCGSTSSQYGQASIVEATLVCLAVTLQGQGERAHVDNSASRREGLKPCLPRLVELVTGCLQLWPQAPIVLAGLAVLDAGACLGAKLPSPTLMVVLEVVGVTLGALEGVAQGAMVVLAHGWSAWDADPVSLREPTMHSAIDVAGYVITVTTYHNAGNFNTTLQGRLVLRAHPPTTANHTRAHTHMHATSLSRRRPVRTSPLRPSIPLLCPLRWSPALSRGADGRSQTPWTPGCTATAPIGTGIVPRSR